MMIRQALPCLLLAVLGLVGASGAWAAEVVPVAEVVIEAAGDVFARYLIADSYDPEVGPGFTAALLESRSGVRLLETDRLDREAGQSIQRLEDLASGWWIELTHDFGFGNLGSPEDYADSMEWALALRDREARERAPSTFTLRLSDGQTFEWIVPYGQSEVAEERREAALAGLAAWLSSEDLPTTSTEAIELLAVLGSRDEPPRLIADRLVDHLWRAFQAAELAGAAHSNEMPKEMTVRRVPPGGESQRLAKIIEHNVTPADRLK